MKKNKNIFRSPGYTKPSVQSVTFLRRLSRLPASHPALPGISRCKTRRELKFPRCGNAHISSNTLAYAGAGWLLPLLLRGLYLLHIQYAGFFPEKANFCKRNWLWNLAGVKVQKNKRKFCCLLLFIILILKS